MDSPLVTPDGQVRLGVFDSPVGVVNHADFDLRDPFGKKVGRLARRFAFNQFQFVGLLSRDLVIGCAIADVRYVSTAFVYLFEPAGDALVTRSLKAPLARGTHQDLTPESGRASFVSGRNRVEIEATAGRRRLAVSLADGLRIDAVLDESGVFPMRVCTRAGATGWVFTRKASGLPVTGSATVGSRTHDLAGSTGLVDWSAATWSARPSGSGAPWPPASPTAAPSVSTCPAA